MQTRREPFSTPLNNLHKTSLKKEENWSTMRHIFATKFCDGGAVDGNLRLPCLWISWGWELAWIGCSVRSSRRWRCDVTPVNTNTLNHSLTMEHHCTNLPILKTEKNFSYMQYIVHLQISKISFQMFYFQHWFVVLLCLALIAFLVVESAPARAGGAMKKGRWALEDFFFLLHLSLSLYLAEAKI